MGSPNPSTFVINNGQLDVRKVNLRFFPQGTGVPINDNPEAVITRTSAGVYAVSFRDRYPFCIGFSWGVELATPATVTIEATNLNNISLATDGTRIVIVTALNLAGSAADIAANAANSISLEFTFQASVKRSM